MYCYPTTNSVAHTLFTPPHEDVEYRRQAKMSKIEIQIVIAISGFSRKTNCIKMSTNKPSIGAVVLESLKF